jgi:hypothetical protein
MPCSFVDSYQTSVLAHQTTCRHVSERRNFEPSGQLRVGGPKYDSSQGMDFFFCIPKKKRCKNAAVKFVMPVHVSTCEIWKSTKRNLTKFDIWEFYKKNY